MDASRQVLLLHSNKGKRAFGHKRFKGKREGAATKMALLLRLAGLALLGSLLWRGAEALSRNYDLTPRWAWSLGGGVLGAALGLAFAPRFVTGVSRSIVRRLRDVPTPRLAIAIGGLVLGLVIAALLSVALRELPSAAAWAVPLGLAIFLAYLGVAIGVARERDVLQMLRLDKAWGSLLDGKTSGAFSTQILLDTSAIIDGRIADVSHAGFLSGRLVIPRFVLDELRRVADSSDPVRRARGRRGLEMLNKLRNEAAAPVEVTEYDVSDVREVDSKLVKMAKALNAPIVTTDYNLNRVAQIEGVKVLNVNELANAVRPVVLPGEEMTVRILQEGREVGQGISFMDDGTLVVVENGRRFINTEQNVVVTRVLQTATGRIIFTQLREQG